MEAQNQNERIYSTRITHCAVSQSENRFNFMADIKSLLLRKNHREGKNGINLEIEKIEEEEKSTEFKIDGYARVRFDTDLATITTNGFSFYDLIFQFEGGTLFSTYEGAKNIFDEENDCITGWLKYNNYEYKGKKEIKNENFKVDFGGKKGDDEEQISTKISNIEDEREEGMDEDEMMSLMNKYYLSEIRQMEGMEDFGRRSDDGEDSYPSSGDEDLSIEEEDISEEEMSIEEEDPQEETRQVAEVIFAAEDSSTDEGELSFEMHENIREIEERTEFPFALRSEKIPNSRLKQVLRNINYGKEDLRRRGRVRVLKRSVSLKEFQDVPRMKVRENLSLERKVENLEFGKGYFEEVYFTEN